MPFFKSKETLNVEKQEEIEIILRCKHTESGFSKELIVNGENLGELISIDLKSPAHDLPVISIERYI